MNSLLTTMYSIIRDNMLCYDDITSNYPDIQINIKETVN